MKKPILLIVMFALFALSINSCNSETTANNNPVSDDSIKIADGEKTFNTYCSGCHNFRQNGIGPQLSGVLQTVSPVWINNFIKNPKNVIQSGDAHAQVLYKQYKTIMPAFANLDDDQIKDVVSFLNTHNQLIKTTNNNGKEVTNPVPEKIQLSKLVVQLKLLTQIPPSSDSNKMPLARITKLDFQPNTKELFVNDLRGKLYELNENKATVFLDIAKLKPNFISEPGLATGFGSFAFHPDFAKNGLFYTTHSEKANSAKADFALPDSIKPTLQWVITEWKINDPKAKTFSGSSREILRIDMVSSIHGVQDISFNPLAKPGDEDYGLLYIGVGDGGCTENGYPFLAHNISKVWGTILRIDPKGNNSKNGKYGIPKQNPFVNNKNAAGEIYAYGFRNPHRITWLQNGKMLAFNIGQNNIESINIIKKGNDYGWPIREGRFTINSYGNINKVYALPANDSSYHITYPVAMYDHDEGKAISGGYEYAGNAVPLLKGKILFGDIPTGRLFYVNANDLKQGSEAALREFRIEINGALKNFTDMFDKNRVDLRFGKDAQGEMYMLTKADGKIYKIIGAKE